MKNILIIGGAGFIGCNTAKYYLDNGYNVTVLDNLSRKGTSRNLEWLLTINPRLEFIRGDIVKDIDLLKKAVKNKDVTFHFAAQVAVTTSVENPREDFMINALGTFNVLEAIRLYNKDCILLYSSTNKVYGGMENVKTQIINGRYQFSDISNGISENWLLDFHSPYGCSKGTADQYVRDYYRIYNLKTIVFRQSCIYGYRQFGVEDQGWVAWFCIASFFNNLLTIYGDGKQVRDVLFIDDLVEAFHLAISNPIAYGQVYNIGGGPQNQLSLLELIEFLKSLFPKKVKYTFSDWRLGDQPVFICNITKANMDFGWFPKTSVEKGVKKLCKWIIRNETLFKDYL